MLSGCSAGGCDPTPLPDPSLLFLLLLLLSCPAGSPPAHPSTLFLTSPGAGENISLFYSLFFWEGRHKSHPYNQGQDGIQRSFDPLPLPPRTSGDHALMSWPGAGPGCSRTYQQLVTEVFHVLEVPVEYDEDRDRSQNTGASFKRNIGKLIWTPDRGILDKAMPSGYFTGGPLSPHLPRTQVTFF